MRDCTKFELCNTQNALCYAQNALCDTQNALYNAQNAHALELCNNCTRWLLVADYIAAVAASAETRENANAEAKDAKEKLKAAGLAKSLMAGFLKPGDVVAYFKEVLKSYLEGRACNVSAKTARHTN